METEYETVCGYAKHLFLSDKSHDIVSERGGLRTTKHSYVDEREVLWRKKPNATTIKNHAELTLLIKCVHLL